MLPRKTTPAIPTVKIIPPKKLHESNPLSKHEQSTIDMTEVEGLFSVDTVVVFSIIVSGVVVVLEVSVIVVIDELLVGIEVIDWVVDFLDVVIELL